MLCPWGCWGRTFRRKRQKSGEDIDRENMNREAQRLPGKLLKENPQEKKDKIMTLIQLQK